MDAEGFWLVVSTTLLALSYALFIFGLVINWIIVSKSKLLYDENDPKRRTIAVDAFTSYFTTFTWRINLNLLKGFIASLSIYIVLYFFN